MLCLSSVPPLTRTIGLFNFLTNSALMSTLSTLRVLIWVSVEHGLQCDGPSLRAWQHQVTFCRHK